MDDQGTMATLLSAARKRGDEVLSGGIVPRGLDKFSVYTGLIHSAIELGKIVESEARDLKAIETHYDLEMARINAALHEVEAAMLIDFERDDALRTNTFESINLLIAAGQYEVAAEFHKRMLEKLNRPALEVIVEHRNHIVGPGGTQWRLR